MKVANNQGSKQRKLIYHLTCDNADRHIPCSMMLIALVYGERLAYVTFHYRARLVPFAFLLRILYSYGYVVPTSE